MGLLAIFFTLLGVVLTCALYWIWTHWIWTQFLSQKQPQGETPAPAKESALPLELFQQAIALSANGLILCDAQQPDMPIVYTSPSFEALTGYSAEEVIGQNCRFLQGTETEQIGTEDIRQAIATGTSCKVLLRNYRKNGQSFWNEITLSPLTDSAGHITHYVGTQIDISHYLDTFKALQESEARYRHLYEETPAMMHSIDRRGNLVNVSHYWLEKLGYQRQEVLGQPLIRFVAAASKPKVEQILSAITVGQVCRNMPCQFIKKNGQPMDALLSTISERDGDRDTSASRSLGVLIDITERKKAKEKLRRSEALLRAINNLPPTGIFVMDSDTSEALFINSEFYRIWQLEHLQESVMRGQFNGEQLLTECLSNVDLGAFISASTAEDFTHGNRIVEDEVPLLNGRILRRIYGPIQENNNTFAYLYVFEDITERKQSERRLAEATEAAEAANLAKSEFLANMSHELRSPLNAILGFTHILKENNLKASSSSLQESPEQKLEQREHLDIIYNSGEHLLALINDILDISKIEAGRVVLSESEFDLHRLLDELQQMFHNTAQRKGLSLNVSRSPHLPRIIHCDRLKLRQILINLLSNAIKFTNSGSVELAVSELAETLTFTVTDTGLGIAERDRTRLFEAFVQTESGLTAAEGTGLGLTISKEYVQLLGGELTVSSVLGQGSTFAFSIANTAVEAAITPSESLSEYSTEYSRGSIVGLDPQHQTAYRILVVDDVALNRKLLTHLLSGIGFEVQEATNGEEAIAQWQSWQPHLIWIDMRMPVMTGEQAVRQIRTLEATQHLAQPTKLIALTASDFPENKSAALTSGCDDFVTKPVQAAQVFEKMAQHLGLRYRYKAPEDRSTPRHTTIQPLVPALMAPAPADWQSALYQATLDLDDDTILSLVAQLPPEQTALAQAIKTCLKEMSYKTLIQVLQETAAVNP